MKVERALSTFETRFSRVFSASRGAGKQLNPSLVPGKVCGGTAASVSFVSKVGDLSDRSQRY